MHGCAAPDRRGESVISRYGLQGLDCLIVTELLGCSFYPNPKIIHLKVKGGIHEFPISHFPRDFRHSLFDVRVTSHLKTPLYPFTCRRFTTLMVY
jgi:hypothetical protein